MASFIVILVYHYPVHISLPLRKISTPITKVDFTNHHYKYQHEQQQLRCIFRVFHYYFLVLNQFSHESPHKTQHFKIEKKAIWRIFFKETKSKNHFLGISKKKKKNKYSWLLLYSLAYEKIIRGPFPIFQFFHLLDHCFTYGVSQQHFWKSCFYEMVKRWKFWHPKMTNTSRPTWRRVDSTYFYFYHAPADGNLVMCVIKI